MASGDRSRPPDASHVSLFPAPPWQLINKYDTSTNYRSESEAPRPPTPPISSVYRMFGNLYNIDDSILRSLESQGVRRVYPQHNYNRKRELRKINFSILANYLDLLDVITRDPSSPRRTEKLDHLAILFINMHHLVNEYRQHQARDLLREILFYQSNIASETREKAEQYLVKAEELLSNAGSELVVPGARLSSTSNCVDTVSNGLGELGPELAPLLRGILEETLSESTCTRLFDMGLPPQVVDAQSVGEGPVDTQDDALDYAEASHLDPALWNFLHEAEDVAMTNDDCGKTH